MKHADPEHFHKLFGIKKTRISFQKKDFIDYVLMNIIGAVILYFAYGSDNLLAHVGIALCVLMIIVFPIRHGFEFRMPVILRRPQDILYMILYKLQNITPVYVYAVGLLMLENYLIFLTPDLPHKVELMHEIAIHAFYLHFILIVLYRTVILAAHLYKKALVREVLMQSYWKNHIVKQPNITLEIFHAYFTGILTHIIFIAPWYIIINHVNYSVIFLPIICVINIILSMKFMKVINAWFYREHWLGHNSEFEFLYLHGSHHDAVPSGLIGVAGNGHLEGFMQNILVFPNPFYNPVISFLTYTIVIKDDIDKHQFIPGIFPQLTREYQQVSQHSIHHFGRLEPYGFAINLDQPDISDKVLKELKMLPDEYKHSIKLDEQLTGFKWDNARYKWYLNLVDKYQNR